MLRIQTPQLLLEDSLSGVPVSNDDIRTVLEMEGITPRVGENVFYAADQIPGGSEQVIIHMRERVASILDEMGFSVFTQPQASIEKSLIWKPLTEPGLVFKHTKGFRPKRFDVPEHPNLVSERIFPLYNTHGQYLPEAFTVAPSHHGVQTLAEIGRNLSIRIRLNVLLDALRGSNAALFPHSIHHSDVKPANIFAVEQPQGLTGKLFDFEGVGLNAVKSDLYSPSAYFGKHTTRLRVGHDIFSYGISLLEILTDDDAMVSFYNSWQKRRGMIDKFAPPDVSSLRILELYSRGFSHLLHDFCARNSIPALIETTAMEMLDPRFGDVINVSSIIRRIESAYQLKKF